MSYQIFSVVWKYFLIITAFTVLFVPNAYAVTIGNYEKQLPDNLYAFGNGIMEYQEKSLDPCTIIIPNYSVKSTNTSQTPLNLEEFTHNFFIVLGNHNDESYQYLQIGLPPGSGAPSYLLDLKNNEGEKLRGELYVDYDNLAVILESDITMVAFSCVLSGISKTEGTVLISRPASCAGLIVVKLILAVLPKVAKDSTEYVKLTEPPFCSGTGFSEIETN